MGAQGTPEACCPHLAGNCCSQKTCITTSSSSSPEHGHWCSRGSRSVSSAEDYMAELVTCFPGQDTFQYAGQDIFQFGGQGACQCGGQHSSQSGGQTSLALVFCQGVCIMQFVTLSCRQQHERSFACFIWSSGTAVLQAATHVIGSIRVTTPNNHDFTSSYMPGTHLKHCSR